LIGSLEILEIIQKRNLPVCLSKGITPRTRLVTKGGLAHYSNSDFILQFSYGNI